MKHTPGPYNFIKGLSEESPSAIVESKEQFICQTVAGNDEANAEFIVKACNSHYDLLEALKGTLSWLSSYPGGGAIKAWERAHEAIKKAEANDS